MKPLECRERIIIRPSLAAGAAQSNRSNLFMADLRMVTAASQNGSAKLLETAERVHDNFFRAATGSFRSRGFGFAPSLPSFPSVDAFTSPRRTGNLTEANEANEESALLDRGCEIGQRNKYRRWQDTSTAKSQQNALSEDSCLAPPNRPPFPGAPASCRREPRVER
jgi:hypothetical protein